MYSKARPLPLVELGSNSTVVIVPCVPLLVRVNRSIFLCKPLAAVPAFTAKSFAVRLKPTPPDVATVTVVLTLKNVTANDDLRAFSEKYKN